MNFTRIGTLALFFSQFSIFAQPEIKGQSRILRSNTSDTAVFHLELNKADYDCRKNNLPYFLIYKPTDYDQKAIPDLVVKKTRIVEDQHAGVAKKYFSDFVGKNFALEQIPSFFKNQNLNRYKLFPFRLNALNQLEELIEYDVTWQVSGANNSASRGSSSFASSSVLSSGNWYKIAVTQTGIHKLTKSFFNGIGINTNSLNHANIRVYGNGGKMLPERNKDFRYDDLTENAIKVVLSPDGTFDYALFYATGTTEWVRTKSTTGLKFRAVEHLYSDTNFYFINVDLGPGKRIGTRLSISQPPDASTSTYDYFNNHEENILNFGKSGREFYGEYFDLTSSYSFTWSDGDFTSDSIIAEVTVAANYKDTSVFRVHGNGLDFIAVTQDVQLTTYAPFAAEATRSSRVKNASPGNDITLTVSKQTAKSIGWLDKLNVNARRSLNLRNRQFSFRESRITGAGKTCNFSLTNSGGAAFSLWNVTDNLNPVEQGFNVNGSVIDFTTRVDSLNEFCIAPSNDYYTPVFVGKVLNQNLHSITKVNYLIVTHPLFVKEAEHMGVFHQQKEGLSYTVATTDQIYNEFSSGKQDVAAIRDFIRMIYSRTISLPEDQQLKYVLLMGDGSYNNKNRNVINNSNLIPTYEAHESLRPIESIVTDDFYGLMDPDEGYYAEDDSNGAVDLGIGRFTCRNVTEVKSVITKIENYYRKDANYVANNSTPESGCSSTNESPMGDWRTWLLFLGDDEDKGTHMIQSDGLAQTVKNVAPNYNIDQINLDAYQRFSTPGGNRYPDAADDFLKRIKKGTLIFNYTGHGGEVGLTAERMIDMDIVNGFDNFNKLPLFITATCEFSRYDDPGRTSAGEACLLNPKGGAIALYTTCRVAYSTFNEIIHTEVLKRLFTRLPNGKWPTLGDAIALTKATVGQNYYYANFHLLGDPAMMLSYPEDKVVTSHFNNVAVTPSVSDTLGALSKITVKGFIADNAGNKLSNFNGLVYPTVFDKEQTVVCLMNTVESGVKYSNQDTSGIYPFQFKMQKNILYRGKSLVTNGDFSFTFMVPKDISFAPGPGKISYYATNGVVDATGYYSQLIVGGTSVKGVVTDNEGPQVNLFLNDKNFVNGGLTNEKPILFADLLDSSGINTIGTGIGHDISVILDANSSKPVVLNDYYEANLNSYQSGRVRYPYDELTEGEHSLTFRVWDIQNNSTTVTSDFIVAKSAELALKHVLNYPNPFTTRTKFIFQHNQACNPLKVTVQIYTISGKIVKTIQKSTICEGATPEGIEWDGRDDYGDKLGRGVYIYKLAILDVDNKKAEKIEKLVILN